MCIVREHVTPWGDSSSVPTSRKITVTNGVAHVRSTLVPTKVLAVTEAKAKAPGTSARMKKSRTTPVQRARFLRCGVHRYILLVRMDCAFSSNHLVVTGLYFLAAFLPTFVLYRVLQRVGVHGCVYCKVDLTSSEVDWTRSRIENW